MRNAKNSSQVSHLRRTSKDSFCKQHLKRLFEILELFGSSTSERRWLQTPLGVTKRRVSQTNWSAWEMCCQARASASRTREWSIMPLSVNRSCAWCGRPTGWNSLAAGRSLNNGARIQSNLPVGKCPSTWCFTSSTKKASLNKRYRIRTPS